jgi:hypothetical protein
MADMAQGEQIEYALSYGDRVYPGSDGTGPVGARRLCVVPAGAKCTRCRGTSRGRRVTCTSPASMPRRGQVDGGRARARRMGGAGDSRQRWVTVRCQDGNHFPYQAYEVLRMRRLYSRQPLNIPTRGV